MAQLAHIGFKRLVALGIGEHAVADRDRDVIRVKRALDREQPFSALVELALDDRLVGGAVEFLADLHFDQRPLLLDNEDALETLGEVDQFVLEQGPGAPDLEQANAEIGRLHFVDAEIGERLQDVEIALAGGDDAKPGCLPAVHHNAVDAVGPHIGKDGVALIVVKPRFLHQRMIIRANVEAIRRKREIGCHDRDPVDRAVDGRRRFNGVLEAFEPGPDAGIAR